MLNAISIVAIIVAGLATAAALLAFGFMLGYKFYGTDRDLRKLREELERLQAEDQGEPGDAIITTTPQSIEQKRRAGKLDDEDSAIVTVKSPREVRRQQHERTEAQIDRATGTHR